MAFNFSGLRQNVRMSDFQDDWYGGNTNYAGDQQNNIKMSDLFTVPTTGALASYQVGRGVVNYNQMGGIRYTSTSGATTSDPLPVLQAHMRGRYKASNSATPSNRQLPQIQSGTTSGKGNSVNAKLSDYVGLSDCVLTTDTCGESRGVKGGYTTSASGVGNDRFNIQAGVNGTAKGRNVDLSYTDVGYSVYRTEHTNQWTELGLNTKATEGDRILVIACSGGGTMYTFSSTNPIYLRNGTSNISHTVSTHMQPSKNSTGTDDWIAVYSAVVGSGATANRVGVNPFHSSAIRYMFHVFVIKGPNTSIIRVHDRGKHTQQTNGVVLSNATSGQSQDVNGDAYGLNNANHYQPFFMSVVSSPFGSNGFNSVGLNSMGTRTADGVGFDMQFSSGVSTIHNVAYYVSLCNFRGGTRSISFSSGKYSSWYGLFEGYTPQFGTLIPRQDARRLEIVGNRGG